MKLTTLCLSLVSLALAASRKSAPAGALVVGAGRQYTTISGAVAALSNTTTSKQTIFIHPGTYEEQVFIPKLAGPLDVYGYTTDDTSYSKNQVTIVASESQRTQPNNDLTGTLRVHTSNFRLYSVNVRNAFGEGSQAIALSAQAGQQGYYAVALFGYQDTLLSNVGTQLYAKSYIEGATDFIFGQRAQAWFEQCSIGVVTPVQGRGWITASGRNSEDAGWYVINRSRIAAAPGNVVPDGAYYLGRPWRPFARVVFQRSTFSKVINPAGWAVWNVGNEQIDNVFYGEYANQGPVTNETRAEFAQAIANPIELGTVLGEGYARERYVDARYLK